MRTTDWNGELESITVVDNTWNRYTAKEKIQVVIDMDESWRETKCRERPEWMNRKKKRMWKKVKGKTLTEEYKEADKNVTTLLHNAKTQKEV
jgi:hypothetical protein